MAEVPGSMLTGITFCCRILLFSRKACETNIAIINNLYCQSNNLAHIQAFEFSLNNINLTFLALLYKNNIEAFQNQQK